MADSRVTIDWLELAMKRLLLICVSALLFVSGWSHVLAAVFCPNMQDMPGCAMKTERAAHASGHAEMETGDMQMPHGDVKDEAGGALDRPLVSCCASRPDVPPAPIITSRGAERSKQDLGTVLNPASKAIAPPIPAFAPPITSRQHAPPGISTQRHVLISVYLI